MEECGYFEEDKLLVEIELGRFLLASTRFVPWCAHPKHSPVTREESRHLLELHLTCRGMLVDCPIRDKYVDIL